MAFPTRILTSIVTLLFCSQFVTAQAPTEKSPPQVRSYVQGQGVGTVTLKPTHLRISVPIKIVEETYWDATEKLRSVRQEVVDRVIEMNAVEGSIREVGFQCVDATNPTSSFVAPGLNREAPSPQVMAKCYVLADFQLRDLEDEEALIAMSQSQLEELVNLIPQKQPKRRTYSYSTLSSGLSSQQLDNPLALFYSSISKEDRVKAFKQALQKANADLEVALSALGVDSGVPRSIHRNTIYSSSRHSHPVDTAIFRDKESVAISLYPDAVNHTVRLNVSANFELPN